LLLFFHPQGDYLHTFSSFLFFLQKRLAWRYDVDVLGVLQGDITQELDKEAGGGEDSVDSLVKPIKTIVDSVDATASTHFPPTVPTLTDKVHKYMIYFIAFCF
jgi:hypothetical protein